MPALSLSGALGCLLTITAIVAVCSGAWKAWLCVPLACAHTCCRLHAHPHPLSFSPTHLFVPAPPLPSPACPFLAAPAEYLTGAIEAVSASSGINQAFLGLIVLPIAGNAAEHITVRRCRLPRLTSPARRVRCFFLFLVQLCLPDCHPVPLVKSLRTCPAPHPTTALPLCVVAALSMRPACTAPRPPCTAGRVCGCQG